MFYYLGKENLLAGEVTVFMQVPTAIPNYKQIKNFGELVEYEGDSIPAQWEFDGENFYNVKDKPSPFHRKINGKWQVVDKEGFQAFCEKNIDKIKAEILEYGFDYQGHRQKCRDKDVAYMVANIVSLQTAKALGKEKKVTWYFSDNYGMEAGLQELGILMLYGTTFVQSVYDTENYFKTLEELKIVTKEEFEEKRREIHQALAN